MDAVAEEFLLGEFFDENDLGGNEDGGLALFVGNGDLDEGLGVVMSAAFETESAFGHVLALDDVVAAFGMFDAGGIIDFDARVFAAIGARGGGLIGRRGSHGEDGDATRAHGGVGSGLGRS